jgi:hypothetical protein
MVMVDRYLLVLNVIDWFLSCPIACQYVTFKVCSPLRRSSKGEWQVHLLGRKRCNHAGCDEPTTGKSKRE